MRSEQDKGSGEPARVESCAGRAGRGGELPLPGRGKTAGCEGCLVRRRASGDRANPARALGAAVERERRLVEGYDPVEAPFLRGENEDDDGYDPFSDRPAAPEPLFEKDPWR